MSNLIPFEKPIYITKPLLPDIDNFKGYLEEIWNSSQLTNNAAMAKKLERELKQYLKVDNLSLFSNGTAALQIACKVLRLTGEVITTPFTFAATTHALAWCNIQPVFCDIEDETLNIDAGRLENLITEKTTAIMPVHVFGNPCNVDEIQKIADKYSLKVIYDAAHAFGVEVGDRPVGSFGDISMFSLHATKVYHTIEGGALTFSNKYQKERADFIRNFGLMNDEIVMEPGTNAKINEVQAAMGLLVLEMVDREIQGRKRVVSLYRSLLSDVQGLRLFNDIEGVKHNYPYFIVRVSKDEFGKSRDWLFEELKKYNIFSRRYFYPLCSKFQCYRDIPSARDNNLPVALKTADEVLALPLHGRMEAEDVEKICDIIKAVNR